MICWEAAPFCCFVQSTLIPHFPDIVIRVFRRSVFLHYLQSLMQADVTGLAQSNRCGGLGEKIDICDFSCGSEDFRNVPHQTQTTSGTNMERTDRSELEDLRSRSFRKKLLNMENDARFGNLLDISSVMACFQRDSELVSRAEAFLVRCPSLNDQNETSVHRNEAGPRSSGTSRAPFSVQRTRELPSAQFFIDSACYFNLLLIMRKNLFTWIAIE